MGNQGLILLVCTTLSAEHSQCVGAWDPPANPQHHCWSQPWLHRALHTSLMEGWMDTATAAHGEYGEATATSAKPCSVMGDPRDIKRNHSGCETAFADLASVGYF